MDGGLSRNACTTSKAASTSASDPNAILKKCRRSLGDARPFPSTIIGARVAPSTGKAGWSLPLSAARAAMCQSSIAKSPIWLCQLVTRGTGPSERRSRARGPAAIDQLQRALTSVLLNIAEGNGKTSSADRKRFFSFARGEDALQVEVSDRSYRLYRRNLDRCYRYRCQRGKRILQTHPRSWRYVPALQDYSPPPQ